MRIAMIAITTSSSINVNADALRGETGAAKDGWRGRGARTQPHGDAIEQAITGLVVAEDTDANAHPSSRRGIRRFGWLFLHTDAYRGFFGGLALDPTAAGVAFLLGDRHA